MSYIQVLGTRHLEYYVACSRESRHSNHFGLSGVCFFVTRTRLGIRGPRKPHMNRELMLVSRTGIFGPDDVCRLVLERPLLSGPLITERTVGLIAQSLIVAPSRDQEPKRPESYGDLVVI